MMQLLGIVSVSVLLTMMFSGSVNVSVQFDLARLTGRRIQINDTHVLTARMPEPAPIFRTFIYPKAHAHLHTGGNAYKLMTVLPNGSVVTHTDDGVARHKTQTGPLFKVKLEMSKQKQHNTLHTTTRSFSAISQLETSLVNMEENGGKQLLNTEICMFFTIPYNKGVNWTTSFEHEFLKWNEEILMRGLHMQSDHDFEIIMGPSVRSNANTSRFQVHVPSVKKGVGLIVDSLVHGRHGSNCRWIVTVRVDGDDFLEPRFIHIVKHMLVQHLKEESGAKALVISMKNTNPLQLDTNGIDILCDYGKTINFWNYQGSIGLVAAIRRDIWDALPSKFTASSEMHGMVHSGLQKMIPGTKLIHYDKHVGMYLVTRLSGHFKWTPMGICDFSTLQKHYTFDVRNVMSNHTVLPFISLRDSCESNVYSKNLQSGCIVDVKPK